MHRLIALALILLLSSCFDIREEVWIKKDGSGRFAFDYTIPNSALFVAGGEEGIREQINLLTSEVPEIQLDELTITRDGDESHLHLELSTDNLLALMEIEETQFYDEMPPAGADLSGEVNVEIEGLEIMMNRKVDIKKALGLAALSIKSKDRDERRISYIIHLPTVPVEHNADLTADGGKTLMWERTLGEAIAAPIIMDYRTPLPIPWWAFALAAVVIGLVLYGLYRLIRRVKMRGQNS